MSCLGFFHREQFVHLSLFSQISTFSLLTQRPDRIVLSHPVDVFYQWTDKLEEEQQELDEYEDDDDLQDPIDGEIDDVDPEDDDGDEIEEEDEEEGEDDDGDILER